MFNAHIPRQGYNDNNSLQNQLDNQSQITQQILSRNGIADTNNYQYDRLGRMSQDGSPVDNEDWQFSYDSVGNRLTKNKADNSDNTSYSYETNSNRQTQINTTTILRDAAGNTFDDGRRVYQYNAMNRMAQVTDSQTNTTARYTYNFQGQRVRKQLYGGLSADIRYVYGQQGELLGEYDASGKRLKEYVYHYQNNLAELIAQIEADGSVLYIHTDHLATPRLATDQNKSIVWRWVSDGFGEGLANEDADGNGDLTIVNHRFPGQYYDQESGLSYNYFRDYDPSTGRYVQSDPIGLDGGLNTYAYVDGNPITRYDPDGRAWVQVAGGVIGGFVGAYNASQQCNATIGSIATGFGIGAVVGVASTFGAGPWATAFFAGGSAAAGNAVQQAINNGGFANVNRQQVVSAGVTGAALGVFTGGVGNRLASRRVTDPGIPYTAGILRPGQTQRMLPRPPAYGPNPTAANVIDLGLNGTISSGSSHLSTRNSGGSQCGCQP